VDEPLDLGRVHQLRFRHASLSPGPRGAPSSASLLGPTEKASNRRSMQMRRGLPVPHP
jgi:hypothetical protein